MVLKAEDILADLTAAQREAVTHVDGPLLIYAKAGGAMMNARYELTAQSGYPTPPGFNGVARISNTPVGWTVGAGVEAAIDRNWSVKLEYLYMDLGNVGGTSGSATAVTNAPNTPGAGFNTVTTTTLTSAFNSRFTDNIVRVGVNYRFGGPVVARY